MSEQLNRKYRLRIYRIVGIYAAFSLLWIYTSDRVLGAIIQDHDMLTRLSTYKGWLFILVSAGLLHQLISRYARRMTDLHQQTLDTEERFQAIFEGFSDAVVICTVQDGTVLDVNPTACAMYGASREQLLSGREGLLGAADPPFSFEQARSRLAATAQAPQLFEWYATRADGSRFWVEISMRRVSLAGEEQVLAVVREITERKSLDTRLRLVDFSIDHISDAVYWISADRRILDVNASACWVLGYRVEELVGQFLDKIDPGYPSQLWGEHWQQLRERRSITLESMLRTADGRAIPVEVTANFFDFNGVEYNCVIARDISERKQAAEKLQATEQLFTTAFRISPDAINITRLSDGFYLQVNEGFTEITGYLADEVQGRTSLELGIWVDPEDRERMVRELRERGEVSNLEAQFRRKDGRIVIGLISGRLIEIDGELCVLIISRDITARRHLENQNLRSAQLASIGQLAAGVAHEINNPINGVINYAQLLLNRSQTSLSQDEILGRIVKEADRVAEIVKELLFFSRDSKDRFTLTNVEALLKSVLTLTRKYVERHGISIVTDIEPDLPEVYMIPQKIEQVLINLMNNASYALDQQYPAGHPDKQLRISARRVPGSHDELCRLVVYDAGIGIPQELLQKIVQPFFTTKPSGQGTGLGMSICRDIVEQHKGQLRIDSVPGEFTEITIDLPLGTGHQPNRN